MEKSCQQPRLVIASLNRRFQLSKSRSRCALTVKLVDLSFAERHDSAAIWLGAAFIMALWSKRDKTRLTMSSFDKLKSPQHLVKDDKQSGCCVQRTSGRHHKAIRECPDRLCGTLPPYPASD